MGELLLVHGDGDKESFRKEVMRVEPFEQERLLKEQTGYVT